MASLAAGSSVTLTLGAYDSVSVEVPGGGACVVEYPVGTRIAYVNGGSRVFGPHGAGSQVKLTAEGRSVGYDAADGSEPASSVSGAGNPAVAYRASGRISAPVSTFNGAAASGALGKPADILIPAGTLVDGSGQIHVWCVVRKTGADAASYLQIHGGPTNGTGDPNLLGGGANVTNYGFSATGLEVVIEATFAYKSGGFGVTHWRARDGDGSLSVQVGEYAGAWNNAVNNYLNFVVSSATAGNTYDLLEYEVAVFA